MEKKRIKFPLPTGEIINLTKISDPKKKQVAFSPPLGGFFGLEDIKITPLFDNFSPKEQVAIVYHELWHRKNNEILELKMCLKRPWLIFYQRPILHAQEYEADLAGARLGGKKNMLSVLKKLKDMIEEGILDVSHEKTHPPIEDRIKRIMSLKE